jgi:GntR family transcriptional regulator, transcriptional repressor for pyruvate dehydrogenase complex
MTGKNKAINVQAGEKLASVSAINVELMAAVRKGRYLPGAQFPNERKLAEAFGASRQQVRDALLILNEVGLIYRKVGSGTWLSEDAPQIIARLDADISGDAVRDLSFLETIEARLIFEPGVSALAARHVSASAVESIKQALDAILVSETWSDLKSSVYRFSRACYVASGNRFLLWTFDQIIKARTDSKVDSNGKRGDVAEIVRNHKHEQLAQIYRAIADGDEVQAANVTRNYLVAIAASSGID